MLLPGCGCCSASDQCECGSHAPYYIEYGTKSSLDYRCGLPANWKTTWCGGSCADSDQPYFFDSNVSARSCNAVGVTGNYNKTIFGGVGSEAVGLNVDTDYPFVYSGPAGGVNSQRLGNRFRALQLGWWEVLTRGSVYQAAGVELRCTSSGSSCGGKLLRQWTFYSYVGMWDYTSNDRLEGYTGNNAYLPFFSQTCIDNVYDPKCTARDDWKCCTESLYPRNFHLPVPIQFTINKTGVTIAHSGQSQFFPLTLAQVPNVSSFYDKEWSFAVKADKSCHQPANCTCDSFCQCTCNQNLNSCCNPLP